MPGRRYAFNGEIIVRRIIAGGSDPLKQSPVWLTENASAWRLGKLDKFRLWPGFCSFDFG